MPSATSGAVNFANINSDMIPATDDVFDLGGVGARWRNVRIGNDLVIGGNLTVEGVLTTIESVTLTVQDKNIELASVALPTDIIADGGGITLKGDTDKTILWKNATDSWDFNQAIRTGNLQLSGNTLSTLTGDFDVTTQTGGVFKFNNDAFRAGLDANNYLEIGHGGSNSFVNSVGIGGMDFRFGGVTKATFTTAGHLHLMTDVDQKHTLKIITANNANDTGIAWENSGGAFTHTIFRTDVGSNRADLVFAGGQNSDIDLLVPSFKIHGEAADEGKLEVLGQFQISSGNPGTNKVLTSDADGIATWVLPSGGGFTDAGATIILTNINDSVGIGESGPDSKLHVTNGGSAGTVTAIANTIATFESPGDGYLSILTPNANERGIFFGEPASNVAGAIIYNSTTTLDGFEFRANGNVVRMSIDGTGITKVNGPGGVSVGGFPSGALHITSTLAAVNSNAVITGHNLFGGNKQLWYLGSTSSSNDNIAFINRQNAELHFHTNDLNRFTIQAGGNVGIGQTDPSEKLEVAGNIKVTTVIDSSIYAQLSSSVDQDPADTNPTVITYNTQDGIAGITHSTTVNPGEITIVTEGLYNIVPQPQVGKTSGAAKTDFDMFLQVDRGSGFVDEPDSNIKLTIKDSDITDVIVSDFDIELNVGDKIRMMQRISSSSVGLGLKNTDAETGPPTVPRTPSIIFKMHRVGGLPV